jgi:hypothetical protein
MMSEKIGIPRRRVKKNWYVGLHSDPVDRSHPDVNDDLLVMEAAEKMSRKLFLHSYKFYICSILSLLSWVLTIHHLLQHTFWKRVLEELKDNA